MKPYTVLNLDHNATPRDIVQAAVKALQEKNYSAREVAEARKQLMDPGTRLILDFVHTARPEQLINGKNRGASLVTARADELTRLTLFDHHV